MNDRRWIVLVDIDGTIAESSLSIHPRNEAEWKRRLSEPIKPIRAAIRHLQEVATIADVAFVSGRPQHTRELTSRWLLRHARVACVELHLCAMGTDKDRHKEDVYRYYDKIYENRVAMIDDAFIGSAKNPFKAPAEWGKMLQFIRAQSVA